MYYGDLIRAFQYTKSEEEKEFEKMELLCEYFPHDLPHIERKKFKKSDDYNPSLSIAENKKKHFKNR